MYMCICIQNQWHTFYIFIISVIIDYMYLPVNVDLRSADTIFIYGKKKLLRQYSDFFFFYCGLKFSSNT